MKANVAMNGVDTEVLMTSYIEDNTSKGKSWIFDSGNTIMYVPKRVVQLLDYKEGRDCQKWWMARLARLSALRQSMLQKKMGQCVLWRRSEMSLRHSTI